MCQQSDMFVLDKARSIIHCFSAVLNDSSSRVVGGGGLKFCWFWLSGQMKDITLTALTCWNIGSEPGRASAPWLAWAWLVKAWYFGVQKTGWKHDLQQERSQFECWSKEIVLPLKEKKGEKRYWFSVQILLVERHRRRLSYVFPVLLLKWQHKINEILQLLFLSTSTTRTNQN